MSRDASGSREDRVPVSALRWTLTSALWGGGLFAAVSVYRSVASGGPILQHLNPIGVFTVIGATVGGLIGPMVGAFVERRRRR